MPIVVTTSSSIMSEIKNCGSPREYTIFSPRFFYVLHDIRHRTSQAVFMLYHFKIASPELFIEKSILHRNLPSMAIQIIIVFFK